MADEAGWRMSMVRVLTLVVAVLFTRVTTAQVDCSSEALLAVEAKSGQFLSSSTLEPADLKARVNGKPVSISGVQPEGDKTTVVILMDASESMVKSSGIELELARRIIATLPPAQPTMLVAFAEQSELVASDRAETAKWLQTVAGLKQGPRRTALWDSIDKALRTVSSPHPIFVVLSDGEDNISKVHADSELRKLRESEVRMIWVETRTQDFQAPEERQRADETAQVAAATGGFAIRSAHGFLASSYIDQAGLAVRAVGAYSRVRLDLPPDTPGTGKLKISVASNRPELKGGQLVYPEHLRYCSSQTASH
jgi:VWA domain containing CoxE-like protein